MTEDRNELLLTAVLMGLGSLHIDIATGVSPILMMSMGIVLGLFGIDVAFEDEIDSLDGGLC